MFRFIYVLIFSLCFFACKKDDDKATTEDFGYEYYPLNIGRYVEYNVEHIVYDDFFDPVKVDTFQYFLKEVLDSTFLDNMQQTAYRIRRYKKDTDTAMWSIQDVWWTTRNATKLEVVEENIRIIKLIFPMRLANEWDGNAFNTSEAANFKLVSLDDIQNINELSFSETAKVLQVDEENLIEKNYAEEIYAKNVGLIYREETFIKTNVDGSIKSGSMFKMTVNDYGKM